MTFWFALVIAVLALVALALSRRELCRAEALLLEVAEVRAMDEAELGTLDARDAGLMTEAAAIIGGQVWVRELVARGAPVPEVVTVVYLDVEERERVTSVARDEAGVQRAGRR